MHIGVVFPQVDLAGDPAAVRRFGTVVEQLGFHHLVAYDHVLGASHLHRAAPLFGPYTERDPFHDPFVLFGHLSAVTTTLRFATGVLVLPQRQTALVARQAADVALLSGNRLRLGVGIGWNPVEYEALGQPFDDRAARLEEQIPLLRRLWTESLVETRSRFHTIDRAACVPRPERDIPIWVGGWVDAALRRAARLADGFIFAGDADGAEQRWRKLQDLLEAAERPRAGFGAEAIVNASTDPAEVVGFVERWEACGGTHVGVVTNGLGFESVDAHLSHLERVAALLRDEARL